MTVVLFCAWLAWSRFRVILALPDRTMPSVISALDRTQRVLGGAPTYRLTDNERTVTTAHVAGLPVRNRTMLSWRITTVCRCTPVSRLTPSRKVAPSRASSSPRPTSCPARTTWSANTATSAP